MRQYDDEDNAPMIYDIPEEYKAIINDRLYRETGVLEVMPCIGEGEEWKN